MKFPPLLYYIQFDLFCGKAINEKILGNFFKVETSIAIQRRAHRICVLQSFHGYMMLDFANPYRAGGALNPTEPAPILYP
jgi:hypothetical protein